MKDNKGITIISLIVTIVAMIILTAIAVQTALNTGVISNAKKSNFISDISIIIEAFNKEKVKYADQENFSINLYDIKDLNQDIKDKYSSSIIMYNDKIYITKDNNFSDLELEWLTEMKIGLFNYGDSTHTHVLGSEFTFISKPDCINDGEKSGKCILCGQDATLSVSALGHNYVWKLISESTCIEKGIEVRACSNCGDEPVGNDGEKVIRELPLIEHAYGNYVTTVEPTCITLGTEVKTCTYAPCSKQVSRDIAMIAHPYGDWITTVEPTCITLGTEVKTCTYAPCSKQVSQDIAMIAHTYGEYVRTTDPTCTTTGVNTRTCTSCNTAQETQTVAALGHNYTSTDEINYACSRCTSTYIQFMNTDLTWASAFNVANTSNSITENTTNGTPFTIQTYGASTSSAANYGSAVSSTPIDLTNVDKIEFKYTLFDNLYASSGWLLKKYTKGKNTSYFGVVNSSEVNNISTDFASQTNSSLIASSTSSSSSYTKTLDVSSLTGIYYLKVFTRHGTDVSNVSISDHTAYRAKTTLSSVKLITE